MYAMTFVMLSTLLCLEGGLLADRTPTAGLLLGAAETAESVPPRPLSDLTLEELEAERQSVLATRPSLIPPMLVIGAGAIGFTIGTGILLFSTIIVGSFVMGVAAVVVIVGIVLVLNTGPARAVAARRLKEIDRAVTDRKREQLRPPPPAILPPGVQWGPPPSLLLASF